MIRDFKARRSAAMVSAFRYFCRYQIPEVLAGLALLVLLVLLPVLGALMF